MTWCSHQNWACCPAVDSEPVIASTNSGSELASIIEVGDCGIVIPPEDGPALASAIKMLLTAPERLATMAANGRAHALANLASKVIHPKFERQLVELAASK